MGEKTNRYGIFVGKPEGKSHLEDEDVDGKVKLSLCSIKHHAMETYS
jgi:hypothetical protein